MTILTKSNYEAAVEFLLAKNYGADTTTDYATAHIEVMTFMATVVVRGPSIAGVPKMTRRKRYTTKQVRFYNTDDNENSEGSTSEDSRRTYARKPSTRMQPRKMEVEEKIFKASTNDKSKAKLSLHWAVGETSMPWVLALVELEAAFRPLQAGVAWDKPFEQELHPAASTAVFGWLNVLFKVYQLNRAMRELSRAIGNLIKSQERLEAAGKAHFEALNTHGSEVVNRMLTRVEDKADDFGQNLLSFCSKASVSFRRLIEASEGLVNLHVEQNMGECHLSTEQEGLLCTAGAALAYLESEYSNLLDYEVYPDSDAFVAVYQQFLDKVKEAPFDPESVNHFIQWSKLLVQHWESTHNANISLLTMDRRDLAAGSFCEPKVSWRQKPLVLVREGKTIRGRVSHYTCTCCL